jgi:hypothetical protein
MLTIIKASLLGSALMLLGGCGYLTSYQTPCVQGHEPPGGVPSGPITQLRELPRARKVCQRSLAASFRLTS